MLSENQYNELLPTRWMLFHIYGGGSSHRLPLELYIRIWNELGKFPVDMNCNACKVEMAKELFIEILNFEEENEETIIKSFQV